MAITINQLDPMVQSAVGRSSTPYEQKTFSTASPQTLANLSGYYSGLNKDASLVDYLKYTGEDPSLNNRIALGQKYGITNVGTAEGNTALLNALKGGQAAPAPTPVSGTVIPPADTNKSSSYSTGDYSPEAVAWREQQYKNVPGSIETAAATTGIDANSDIKMARQNVNDAYSTQQSLQQQIREIDNATTSAMQNRREAIARSGGVVDESQLRSEVLMENAPLLAQRKELVTQYTQANQAYQKALADRKDIEANYYKQANLELAQTKVSNQEQQFQTKTEQAGWKMSKVNILDSAGNVLGQKLVWTQNPANISSDNAASTVKTSSGTGGISSTGVTNVGNVTATQPPKITIADGATPEQVLQSLITGPAAVYKGSTIPVSQQTLYNLAIADLMGSTSTAGGRTPSALIPIVKSKESDIMDAYGLTPFDIASAKAEFKNLSSTNAKLLERSSFTNLAANIAKDNLDLVVESSKNVPRGGAKIVNKVAQWLQGNYTPAGPLAELETYIYTYAREYAKVTSGSAQSIAGLTESATREAEKLLSAAQAPETLATVAKAMGKDMQNVIDENNKAVNQFPDSVKKLYGLVAGPSTDASVKTVKSNGQTYNVGQVYNDGTSNWVIDAQGIWTQQK